MVNATPRPLYPREGPDTHCVLGWVGLRAGLDGCGKSRPPPGFDPRTVQPVAIRYTDYTCRAMVMFLKPELCGWPVDSSTPYFVFFFYTI